MPADPTTGGIAHAIQLAIAPVRLLTVIAGRPGVMANRLARVIDRGRNLEHEWRNIGLLFDDGQCLARKRSV